MYMTVVGFSIMTQRRHGSHLRKNTAFVDRCFRRLGLEKEASMRIRRTKLRTVCAVKKSFLL